MQKKLKNRIKRDIESRCLCVSNVCKARMMAQLVVWYGDKYPNKRTYYAQALQALDALYPKNSYMGSVWLDKCSIDRDRLGFKLQHRSKGAYGSLLYTHVRLDDLPPVTNDYTIERE